MVIIINTKVYRLALLLALLLGSNGVIAATWLVNDDASLAAALAKAKAKDVLTLAPGLYQGGVEIATAVRLVGTGDAVFDAQGIGSGLIINASDVAVSGISVRNYGGDLYNKDAGILIEAGQSNITLRNNLLSGPGFGIRVDDSNGINISGNTIHGDVAVPVIMRGDGIHLKQVNDIVVEANQIDSVRDAIYLETGKGARIDDNVVRFSQYPVHFMYFDNATLNGNRSDDSDGGYALMSSENIELDDNQVSGAREFGILLNMSTACEVLNNTVEAVINPRAKEMFDGEGKGVFIYGARDNSVHHNRFIGSEIGISMALGGEGNLIYGNQFLGNQQQVKYVGSGAVNWSYQGEGNYWDNHQGWDLNRDGISDQAFVPNDALDRLFWIYPEARFLMDSPVVALLRWLDSQLSKPAPTGVYDPFPLMVQRDSNPINPLLTSAGRTGGNDI
ncbi:nitrous oxide reductase family maturation protein NosD [Ferrimonas lipolytica]|uniref:Nitrous oxide reductase family maturation protein NosD n=1 Tax=Ferrimonas lipolytica TaxID=2724191 RepID=A0A6H1UAV0_9GAMM|nr:nitrous oxide reductase family maturation protein NosD [Ferrimonas lipolytica]QIZ75483.1 nitrous oxide reductase family maturation protein NosD [Ferrimonas lipolytica]